MSRSVQEENFRNGFFANGYDDDCKIYLSPEEACKEIEKEQKTRYLADGNATGELR